MSLSAEEKIDALRELTKGPDDCFATYILAAREGMARWRPIYAPLRRDNILMHLRGDIEIGTYPLLPSLPFPRVYWICADFDGKSPHVDWKGEVQKALEFLLDFDGCPAFVNLSRSGQGAHIRMLFRESVPGWMARRWLTFWLSEAGIIPDNDLYDEGPRAFDRLIPPQDFLSDDVTFTGMRRPGNLAGCPLHGGHARSRGGTLPLDPQKALAGDFRPDGNHWSYVLQALEKRAWGEAELIAAMEEWPDDMDTTPPHDSLNRKSLPVIPGDSRALSYNLAFCEFFRHIRQPGAQTYQLWLALATQLIRFGDEGREMFHQISALDARYVPSDTDAKWEQAKSMKPIRCDTLVHFGYRCPHLKQPRCNGPKAPTYFADHTDADIL